MSPAIQALVTKFVEDLTVAIQEEGAAAFRAAIAGVEPGPALGRRSQPAPKKARAAARAKGAKRSATEIEGLTKNLLTAIKREPGQRIEQIGRALGVKTKDLALPVAKLFEAKAVRTTGQRRATKYFPR